MQQLREAVLSGEITPSTLVRMSSRDMATEDQRRQVLTATRLDLEATSASYIRDNMAQLAQDHGIEHVTETIDGDYRKCAFEVNNKWS